jgi:hypothetical protein
MDGRKELFSRIMLRSCVVLLAIFTASVVPYFGDILSLVSALAGTAVAFIFPVVFYWKLSDSIQPVLKVVLSSILCLGIVGMYFAVLSLRNSIRNNPNPFDHFFFRN